MSIVRIVTTDPGADSLQSGGNKINESVAELLNPLSYKPTGSGSIISPYTDGIYGLTNTYVYQIAYPNAGSTFGTVVVPAGILFCCPSLEREGSSVRRVGVQKTTSTTGAMKLGIYSNNGTNAPYPEDLLYDAGAWNLTHDDADIEYTDINYTFPSDGLYWYCYKFSSTPSLFGNSILHDVPFFGWCINPGNNQFVGSLFGIWFTSAYADSLPATMDSSGSIVANITSVDSNKRILPHIFKGYDVYTA